MDKLEVVDTVKLSKVKRMIETLEKRNHDNIDMDLSFEYVLASLFPTCLDNIKNEMKKQYTLGYMQWYNEQEKN